MAWHWRQKLNIFFSGEVMGFSQLCGHYLISVIPERTEYKKMCLYRSDSVRGTLTAVAENH
jgi:hypothetical protein